MVRFSFRLGMLLYSIRKALQRRIPFSRSDMARLHHDKAPSWCTGA
ncbi:MAG: hypothetical protein ACXIU5_20885 [Halomonadaceae bacterium]|jgi:hypothetical protein